MLFKIVCVFVVVFCYFNLFVLCEKCVSRAPFKIIGSYRHSSDIPREGENAS